MKIDRKNRNGKMKFKCKKFEIEEEELKALPG